MAPERRVDWQAFRIVSQKTGLRPATCYDLLQKGWVYVESLNAIGRWDQPAVNLRKEDHGK